VSHRGSITPEVDFKTVFPFQFLLAMLCGWRQREHEDVIAYLREENRVLKAHLEGQRLRLDEGDVG
jgi:hypothetical protein